MKTIFLAVVSTLLPAFVFAAGEQTQTFSATVESGRVHEECMKLDKGERRRYDWKADAKVDFNIHYHEGKEVFYPVKRNATAKGKGTFRAKVAQEYCWMWSSKTPAKVEGRVW